MNYNLVIDTSHFKPFDISPALLVLHDYRDAYYKLDEELNKIAEEQGEYVLPKSSKYRGVMDRYNEDYNSIVEDFSKGMNLENASKVRSLKKRYASEINPIRKMVENYNKDLEKVQELRRTNPSAIVQMPELEDYYGGVGNKYKYISGNQVASEVSTGTKAILESAKKNYKFNSVTAKGYLELVESGVLPIGTLYNIANNPNTPIDVAEDLRPIVETLSQFYSGVRNRYSFDNMNDESKNALDYHINVGITSSATPTKSSIIARRDYVTPSASGTSSITGKGSYKAYLAELLKKGYHYNADEKGWVKDKTVETWTERTDEIDANGSVVPPTDAEGKPINNAITTKTKVVPKSFIPDDAIRKVYPDYMPTNDNLNGNNTLVSVTTEQLTLTQASNNRNTNVNSTSVTPDSLAGLEYQQIPRDTITNPRARGAENTSKGGLRSL